MKSSDRCIDPTKYRPLPEGWRWVRLGEVCYLNPRPPKDFHRPPDAPTDFVPMAALDASAGAIVRVEQRPYEEVTRGYTYFADGDVLFAKITPCMENGKVALANMLTDGVGFGTTEFHVVRPGEHVTGEWVWLYLRQPTTRAEAARSFEGSAGQKRVPERFLRDAVIPLPPLPVQEDLASRLELQMAEVARMRGAAERQRAATKAIAGAIHHRAFGFQPGDPLPEGWRWARLEDLCSGHMEAAEPDAKPDEEFTYIEISSVDNVTKQIVAPKQLLGREAPSRARQQVRCGDVLVATTRPNLNAVAMVSSEFDGQVCSTGFCVLRPSAPTLGQLLFAFVQSPRFVQRVSALVQGALYPAITDEDVKECLMPVPNSEEQQASLASRLESQMAEVARMRRAAERQLGTLDALPGALLHEVFGGFEPPEK